MPRTLDRRLIDRFFTVLSGQLDRKARVILTGAAAGNLMGGAHPSIDVDFALRSIGRSSLNWTDVENAVRKTVRITGVNADYAEDIDRWGLISLMDYLKHTRFYRRFGGIRVEVLAPSYWSIGKMNRYLDSDAKDMVRVFKARKVPHAGLERIWGSALKKSPKSAALFDFRRHAEDFFRHHGRAIWGKNFDAEISIARFWKAAGIKPVKSHNLV
ncbi:MAG: hypothetical protein A2902_07245 [Elusimicrobia bacterium RIFCSPLOWO2_01_FULL_64_13]|nr:MAG: hypothetical protein A2636_05435 [Elusimicrobia bacterium RIFCSPHIGHO2_01_FULL_64_10]OGR96366.1 MAG: hypothetical protein A2902_07245 [Elusimicrobia bacterium RIFCSPLOWO2_01_FULL_64_13]